MYKEKNYKKASFTVEVSILMPFLVIVILIFFYFVLYMFNRGVIQNALCRGAKQIFYYANEDNQTIEDMCSRTILDDLEGNLIAVKDIELTTEVSSKEIIVEVEGALEVPGLISWKEIGLNDMWAYQLQWREPRLKSAEVLLSGQQIEGIFEKLQEGD